MGREGEWDWYTSQAGLQLPISTIGTICLQKPLQHDSDIFYFYLDWLRKIMRKKGNDKKDRLTMELFVQDHL